MGAIVLAGVAPSSEAAVITYAAPVTESADTDISTLGTSVAAYRFGGGTALTVNGVNFAQFSTSGTTTTVGNTTLATSQGTFQNYNGFGPPTVGFAGSANYGSILKEATFVDNNPIPVFTLTFSGLTVGQQYQLQLFVNDSRSSSRTETISGPAGSNSQTLAYDTTQASGGAGQYVNGLFTADASTQTATITGIIIGGSNDTQINALQLRAVPEPASVGLLGLSGLGLLARRRRGA